MIILHAIHDFLPRHRAGSEIYAAALAKELAKRHHVTVLCAEYDPARAHGHVTWRVHQGLPVVEIVNNWVGKSFEDSYRSPLMTERVDQILRVVQPDVVHVHNLLNLSLELPALARARGIPVVATLHDYTLVCPSGGQRVHRAESHVCWEIDTNRCARCFTESPFYAQMAVGAIAGAAPGGVVHRAAATVRRRFPVLATRLAKAAKHAAVVPVTVGDIDTRMARARRVFDEIDLFVAPSQSMGEEFVRLGVARERMVISHYGQLGLTAPTAVPTAVPAAMPAARPRTPLRVGFVGTIAWHKGLHTLVEAVRTLSGISTSRCDVRIFGDENVAPDYAADVRRRAGGLPIRFEGAFRREDVGRVLAAIDVLVVPSIWPENAPLVIQEAYQAGVPVVGSRIGGIPEFVREGVSGWLFEPGSPADLARVLRGILDRPSQIASLAASLPAVKSIEDDAVEWEDRYRDIAMHGPLAPAHGPPAPAQGPTGPPPRGHRPSGRRTRHRPS